MKTRLAVLLVTGLIAVAAWAQSGRPGAASVDSRAECVALGGNWQARDKWQSACEVPWSREDCLRLGGGWTQVSKASTGGRCFAPVSEFGLAQQCLDKGGSWSPPGSPARQCSFDTPKVRIATQAPDAGKRCDSQQDCTYGCVYEGPAAAPGADVLGRCRATNTGSGCFSMVEGGRLAGSVCRK
jgi:hypothetical protein